MRISDSPPAYQPTKPRRPAGYERSHNAPTSEATPLAGKQTKKIPVRIISIVAILMLATFLVFWGPYLQSGIAHESLGLYWTEPKANAHCSAYNTRDYMARLLNTVPYNYNWLKACEEKPITIHNKSIRTTSCEIKDSGEVYGHWRVDFNEPACTPYWDQFKDKGCTTRGSRHRRIEAHLQDIHWGEDWEKLCASAPYDFYGRHFDHPDSCANRGTYGIFGIWNIDDPSC